MIYPLNYSNLENKTIFNWIDWFFILIEVTLWYKIQWLWNSIPQTKFKIYNTLESLEVWIHPSQIRQPIPFYPQKPCSILSKEMPMVVICIPVILHQVICIWAKPWLQWKEPKPQMSTHQEWEQLLLFCCNCARLEITLFPVEPFTEEPTPF